MTNDFAKDDDSQGLLRLKTFDVVFRPRLFSQMRTHPMLLSFQSEIDNNKVLSMIGTDIGNKEIWIMII